MYCPYVIHVRHIQADMKSDILLHMASIFFLSNLYPKQGIGSVYVMVDFICKGYLELIGTRVERELQNEKFLLTVGFEPGPFAYEANALPLSHEDWCL